MGGTLTVRHTGPGYFEVRSPAGLADLSGSWRHGWRAHWLPRGATAYAATTPVSVKLWEDVLPAAAGWLGVGVADLRATGVLPG